MADTTDLAAQIAAAAEGQDTSTDAPVETTSGESLKTKSASGL
jgi:hypothetical protein